MTRKSIIHWRIYSLFFLIAGFGLAIIGKAFTIQTIEGAHWRTLAQKLTTTYKNIEAERGNVFSADGRLLATSLPYFEIRVDFASEAMTDEIFYREIDSLAHRMAAFFKDKSPARYKRELINARKHRERAYLVIRRATYPQMKEIKSWPLFRLGRYKGGIVITQVNKRVNPYRMLAHRTVGYVREGVQPVGLEGSFDEYLKGEQGKRLMQKISGGVLIPINDKNEINPENGKDIVTTINVNLQDVAESALLKTLQKHDADHGCVVVMEVATGKIRAIANLGKMSDGSYWEKYNYAVGEATEPGSTFKLATMIALLEDGLIDINDSVDLENGVVKFYDHYMRDSEHHNYRKVSIKHAFEISSNVGVSKLAYQHYAHDPGRFISHLKSMRLDQPTGIEIKGEATPFISTPGQENWSGISIPWMSVGYEVRLTPLQVLTFYNAIANQGKMMKPYLVESIEEYGKVVKKFEPQVLHKQICSEETLDKARALLEGVVENGTARNLNTPNYQIAGKTGTSLIADSKYGYKNRKVYQASFVGYFPADNPVYSCIVVVNAPSKGVYYGSYVAGPVFREIADKLYATIPHLHVAFNEEAAGGESHAPFAKNGHRLDAEVIYQNLNVPYQTTAEEWIRCYSEGDTVRFKSREVIEGLVPDVTGMGLKDALYLLENSGLKVIVRGEGKVRTQSIRPGARVMPGQEIIIQLS